MSNHNSLIYAAAGWSGFFTMAVELLGGRLLSPYFGSSIFVWGALIAVVMLCLSAGYLAGGQLSLRNPSLSWLGVLLVGQAVLALPIIATGDLILEYTSYVMPDPRYGSTLGSMLLLGAPMVMAGMVAPYATRLLISNLRGSGRAAGTLFFVSNIGSTAGTILTSFYLVLYLEINTIILVLISVSCAIGVILLFFGRGGQEEFLLHPVKTAAIKEN